MYHPPSNAISISGCILPLAQCTMHINIIVNNIMYYCSEKRTRTNALRIVCIASLTIALFNICIFEMVVYSRLDTKDKGSLQFTQCTVHYRLHVLHDVRKLNWWIMNYYKFSPSHQCFDTTNTHTHTHSILRKLVGGSKHEHWTWMPDTFLPTVSQRRVTNASHIDMYMY